RVPSAVAVCLALAVSSCGAPPSERATGPVAAAVESALASGTETFDHSVWDRLLAEGTRDGLVDYPYFQGHRGELESYLEAVAGADAAALAPAHLQALLINAYNALTLRSILEHPEVSSIRQIDGVWTKNRHRVAGHQLTLDEIEHNLLRPFFRDPRIHFAVNCASMSCAPLPAWAFEGDGLDAQMEERARLFLSDPRNVRFENGELALSRYFEWYGEDFTEEGWSPRAESVPLFVASYAAPEVSERILAGDMEGIRFLDYDWSLNAFRPPEPSEAGASSSGLTAGASSSGLAAGASSSSLAAFVDWLRRSVGRFGMAAPLVYGLAYVVGVILFVPGALITIGAGIAFGLGVGTLLVSLASTTGAALAFLLARYFLRERVERWAEGHARFAAVDRAVEAKGWKVVALTRLSPAFPFNVQNYLYGITGVRFVEYVLASWVAMLPGTLLYVSLGATGVELASAASGTVGWGATALRVLGLLATAGVVVLVTAAARRELRAVTRSYRDSAQPAGT
ncbi:MAG: VTT domain-containing protein, partial [Gemmatimonadetes bacterium]|nr:VTT domain-containing protein [Gemmatimonadota bacterium]